MTGRPSGQAAQGGGGRPPPGGVWQRVASGVIAIAASPGPGRRTLRCWPGLRGGVQCRTGGPGHERPRAASPAVLPAPTDQPDDAEGYLDQRGAGRSRRVQPRGVPVRGHGGPGRTEFVLARLSPRATQCWCCCARPNRCADGGPGHPRPAGHVRRHHRGPPQPGAAHRGVAPVRRHSSGVTAVGHRRGGVPRAHTGRRPAPSASCTRPCSTWPSTRPRPLRLRCPYNLARAARQPDRAGRAHPPVPVRDGQGRHPVTSSQLNPAQLYALAAARRASRRRLPAVHAW